MPWKDYIYNWDAHLSTFWVPAIVGLIFLGLAIQSIIKRQPLLVILYLVLTAACASYMGFSEEIRQFVSKFTG